MFRYINHQCNLVAIIAKVSFARHLLSGVITSENGKRFPAVINYKRTALAPEENLLLFLRLQAFQVWDVWKIILASSLFQCTYDNYLWKKLLIFPSFCHIMLLYVWHLSSIPFYLSAWVCYVRKMVSFILTYFCRLKAFQVWDRQDVVLLRITWTKPVKMSR